jgi:hypothetical protein
MAQGVLSSLLILGDAFPVVIHMGPFFTGLWGLLSVNRLYGNHTLAEFYIIMTALHNI